jgi:hypothetical protein
MSRKKRYFSGMKAGSAGLPQGFIAFGTMNHRILIYMYQNGGRATNPELVKEVGKGNRSGIPHSLGRMLKTKFIYAVDRQYAGHRSHLVYGLTKGVEPVPRPRTAAERAYAYCHKSDLKVRSVFEFRGSISLEP